MLKRVFIVIISMLFMSLFISLTLAQQQVQVPPLMPLEIIYGTAKIDNVPLTSSSDATISIKMENLIVIVMDRWLDQGLIGDIIAELNAGNTDKLGDAFLDSDYCSSRQPPLVLSTGATVTKEADNRWRVNSGQNAFLVFSEQVQIWDGDSLETGIKLEVYQRFGLMDSYKMGDLTTNFYVLEVQNSPNNVYSYNEQSRYLLRDPGKAVIGDNFADRAYIYINNVLVTNPPMPITLSGSGFVLKDINAPSDVEWKLELKPGWTLISYGINKCYYFPHPALPADGPLLPNWVKNVNVSNDGYNSLSDWLNSVISPSDAWDVVMGRTGVLDRLNPAGNSLRYLSPTESYQIKVNKTATLTLSGQYYKPGDEIPLVSGWNWVGYPIMTFYYQNPKPTTNLPNQPSGDIEEVSVPSPLGEYVFDSIIDNCDVIFGQRGVYEPANQEGNSLFYIVPGQGFKIKMREAGSILVYPLE